MIPMAKSMVSVYIQCPYYKREERNRQIKIVCEGILDGTSLHQIFLSVEALKKHRDCFCKGDYSKCPIAAALNRKYDYV